MLSKADLGSVCKGWQLSPNDLLKATGMIGVAKYPSLHWYYISSKSRAAWRRTVKPGNFLREHGRDRHASGGRLTNEVDDKDYQPQRNLSGAISVYHLTQQV
jgi:hypothetical protein